MALELRRTLGLTGKPHNPRLTITQWLAAFDQFALAAVITQQWSMVVSLAQEILIYIYIYSCIHIMSDWDNAGFHVLVRITEGRPCGGSLGGVRKIGLLNMVPALRIN